MGAAAKKIVPPKSRLFGAGAAIIQPSLKVGKPGDKYEKEADSVADQVMMMPSTPQTPIMTGSSGGVQLEEEEEIVQSKSEEEESVQMMPLSAGISMISLSPEEEKELQLKEEEEESLQMMGGNGEVPASVSTQIQGSMGGGSPMAPAVQSEMGQKIGADFSEVKIHTGPQATSMSNALGAQAFTHGSDVYFNEGKYSPESSKGKHLLAHELTHVVQQNHTVRRSPKQNISEGAEGVQRLPWAVREGLSEFASYIPGYTLLCVVVGYDPLAGRSVERNAVNLIGGLMGLIPVFGTLLFNKLQELGIIQDALTWVQDQMDSLDLSTRRIERVLEQAWDEVSLLSGWDANMEVLDRTFGQLYRDVETFAGRVKDKVFELIKEALMSALKALADSFPGYPLLVQLLGHDPLTGEEVNSSTSEKIEAFLLLIGKEQELERMKAEGTIQETADWIDAELAALNFSFEEVKLLFDQAWNAFSLEDLRDPPAAFTRTVAIFAPFTQRVFTFAENVATKVLEFIKNALLAQISAYAREQQGYHLVTVLLGKDPFTEEEVPRSTENIIRGFMGLMPGGEEQFQQMKETGAIEQTVSRIDAAIATLNFSWAYITGLFLDLWNSFTIEDVFHPFDAFVRIVQTLADPIQRLFAFIVTIVKILVEVLLVVMNFPIETVQQIIANARSAFEDIKRDPIGFLKNLLRAVKQGFVQFFDNIVTHLLGGLRDWLFGELATAGISPPADLSFQSILGFVLDVLGISMDNVWERLALKIGPERVAQIRGAIDTLTGIWTFIKDVWERGPIAIWEYIQEQMSNLWNMVLEQVQSWIMTRIVEQITVRLLSMLDPTGIMAVVNSFIAFYRAVQSFIEKLREMLEIVNSFVAGVANIARGTIAEAANFLESALARAVPVAIGFLANQVGLRGLGTRIAEMIGGLREKVNEAIDWLIDRALSVGGAILQAGRNAVAAVTNWWNNRRPVTTRDGHSHEIFFEGTGTSAQLKIASTPINYLNWVTELESNPQVGAAVAGPLRQKAQEIETEKARTVSPDQEDEKNNRIAELFNELVTLTQNAAIPASAGNTPSLYGPLVGGFGTHTHVAALGPGRTGGSEANSSLFNDNYRIINDRKQGSRPFYVRGHLLSWHIGGPGSDWQNLTPLFQNANGDHERSFESRVKRHVEAGGSVQNFSVEAIYGRTISPWVAKIQDPTDDDWPNNLDPAEDLDKIGSILEAEVSVPTSLNCNAELVATDGSTAGVPAPITNDISYPTSVSSSFADYHTGPSPKTPFNLTTTVQNASTDQVALNSLKSLNGVGDVIAGRILQRVKNNQRITNYFSQIGISKKVLERRNPGKRIVQ